MNPTAEEEILGFWLGDSDPGFAALDERISLWFEAGPEVDAEIASRFGAIVEQARRGGLDAWRASAKGRLALIILLDQFSRNLYRGSGEAFSSDAAALRLCLEGIELGLDRELSIVERALFYMPLQHAENPGAQEKSVQVFESLEATCPDAIRPHMHRFLASARSHRDIIAKYGRFPHRNRVLGRECSDAENDFLTIATVPFRSKS
jgi:uncharacterized protein (DUF924 family)